MKFVVTTISPTQAHALLAKSGQNRRIRPSHVKSLARAIVNSEWMLTHQAIAFDTNDRILDGHHRLKAIIEADISVRTILVTGCNPETFRCLDLGAKRSVADVLGSEDRKSIETLTKIARIGEVQNTVTPTTVERYVEFFVDECERVTAATGSKRALIASAPMRAVVAVRLASSDSAYPLDLYKALCESNFEALPPAGRAILPRLLSRRYTAGSKEFLGTCWYLTDQRHSQAKSPAIKNPLMHINEMRIFIRGIMDGTIGVEMLTRRTRTRQQKAVTAK